MTNRGTTCITCRQRRVKCDGRRPNCLRCQKAKRVCQGFDENRKHCRNSQSSMSSEGDGVLTELTASHGHISFSTVHTELPRTSRIRRISATIADILREYSVGTVHFNSDQLAELALQSMPLDAALESVARADLEYKRGLQPVKSPLVLEKYYVCMSELRLVLADPPVSIGPLIAIMLLAFFEVFYCNRESWTLHCMGASNIICHFGVHSRSSSLVRTVLLFGRILEVTRALVFDQEPIIPKTCDDSSSALLLQTVHSADESEKLLIHLVNLLTLLTTLRSKVSKPGQLNLPQKQALLAKCVDLEDQFQFWWDDLPQEWKPILVESGPSIHSDQYPHELVYSNILSSQYCMMWAASKAYLYLNVMCFLAPDNSFAYKASEAAIVVALGARDAVKWELNNMCNQNLVRVSIRQSTNPDGLVVHLGIDLCEPPTP